MVDDPRPLFLLSLPRSGSTLVQRVLAAHREIATLSEPHLLLPFLYATRENGVFAEYGHQAAADAIASFCQELPRGAEDYREELAAFATRLYAKAGGAGRRYFLDKTPRYSLVADQLLRTFPRGKFVVLVRNPLAVIASLMETFKGGRWCLHAFNQDLLTGLPNLIAACREHADRVHLVRYEDLLSDATPEWDRLFGYLGLDFDPELLQRFTEVTLKARGDPTGSRSYRSLSREPLQKWQVTLANPLRKWWCRRYLRWLGSSRLASIGYRLDHLLEELDAVPLGCRHLGSDLVRIPYGMACRVFEPKLALQKLATLAHWRKLHLHY